jgi:transposase
MEQNENAFLKREKKSQTFDKRLVKSIVKAVEEGLPRKQAVALHGMSVGALNEWMKRYGSAAYQAGKRKVYIPSEKRSVLRAVESGMSIREAQISFGIKGTRTVGNWVREAKRKNADLSLGNSTAAMAKGSKSKQSDEVKALQQALAEAELKIKALDTMIDIAEEQLKIDIRKKSGARQSQK